MVGENWLGKRYKQMCKRAVDKTFDLPCLKQENSHEGKLQRHTRVLLK